MNLTDFGNGTALLRGVPRITGNNPVSIVVTDVGGLNDTMRFFVLVKRRAPPPSPKSKAKAKKKTAKAETADGSGDASGDSDEASSSEPSGEELPDDIKEFIKNRGKRKWNGPDGWSKETLKEYLKDLDLDQYTSEAETQPESAEAGGDADEHEEL